MYIDEGANKPFKNQNQNQIRQIYLMRGGESVV
jgi:hypothetical protein